MNKSLITQNIKKNYQLLENNQYGLAEQNAFNLLKEDPNNHEIYSIVNILIFYFLIAVYYSILS